MTTSIVSITIVSRTRLAALLVVTWPHESVTVFLRQYNVIITNKYLSLVDNNGSLVVVERSI